MDPMDSDDPRKQAPFAVQLLGGFAVTIDKEPLAIPSHKEQWLLAKLLLAEGRKVRRQELQDDLWPRSVANDGTYNLRRSLSHLRKALGEHADRLQTPTRETIRFDLNGVFVDALAFEQATQDEHALALYAGPLLPDCDQTWVLAPRQRLHQKFLDRVARLAEERLRSGDLEAVPALLFRALSFDPLWEAGRRLLMRVHAARGEPHEALLLYQELVRHLQRTDPRLVPDPETTALWRQIRDQARQRVPAPVGKEPGAPLPSLPSPATRLIGREREIARVGELLERTRLLTLTGAGGCGKTRLALEVAHRLAASFAEGVCWVELASLSSPDRVAASVAAVLGVKEVAAQALAQTLVNALKSRTLLLVLDNCEHVLEGVGVLAEALLSGCPGVRILATSRAGLPVYGETLYRVPSLSLPPAGGCSLEELWGFESTQLFVERARAANPELRLEEGGASLVSSICRRLDGIPLAIELAAARVRSLRLEELASRLSDRFALLTGGAHVAPARHQTLRALIDWSYGLLSEAEKALLGRLSVFSGGWTLEAAERICVGGLVEEGSVLDLLSSLADQSLVEVLDSPLETRYQFLETIRQFALERLVASGEEEALRDRHLDYFLERAEGKPEKYRFVNFQWMDALKRDHDNLRAALRHAEKQPQVRLRLAVALITPLSHVGQGAEGLKHLRAALAASGPHERTALRVEALLQAACAAYWLRAGPSQPLLEEALSISRELGDREQEACCLNWMGQFCDEGDYTKMRALSEQAWALYNEIDDPLGGHGCLHILCGNAFYYCDFETAWKYLKVAQSLIDEFPGIEEYASSGDTRTKRRARELIDEFPGIESILNWLPRIEARLLAEAGDLESARRVCEAYVVRMQATGIHAYVNDAMVVLGGIYRDLGDYGRAWSVYQPVLQWVFQEWLSMDWEQRVAHGVITGLEEIALLVWARDRSAWSARLWGAAAGLNQRSGNRRPPPWCEQRYARYAASARLALGEAAFAAAWEEGRSMPTEEAIAYALQFEG